MDTSLYSSSFRDALAVGRERLAAWSDLLDRINVFPVADGDTGRNLLISLAPLGDADRSLDGMTQALLMSARGNSGNIAAQFFRGMFEHDSPSDLAGALENGRQLAWKAVADPKPGTMLTLFDALADGPNGGSVVQALSAEPGLDGVLDHLEQAVLSTQETLPALKQAGVVDSGALGMFIFFDGLFNSLLERPDGFRPVAERFADSLKIAGDYSGQGEDGFCIDAVVRAEEAEELIAELSAMGESLVSMRHGDLIKIHLHADDPSQVKKKLQAHSHLLRFNTDDLHQQSAEFTRPDLDQAIHVMTDAAGSVTRADARRLGMTVLDSYINVGEQSVPETHLRPEDLYAAMSAGVSVSTSQASDFERHQHYKKALGMHQRVLYVCVGAAFTGNHQVAQDWQHKHDPDGRMVLLDSQAASGKLALIALDAAEAAIELDDYQAVVDRVKRSIARCREWIFLDQLKFLAAGGRLSKGSAFFGDLLHMKPVISPTSEGAKKVAVLRNRKAQVSFALERLAEAHVQDGPGRIMLAHTDNKEWVVETVQAQVAKRHPESQIVIHPVSLTSGAHMGPGTWAAAYLPKSD